DSALVLYEKVKDNAITSGNQEMEASVLNNIGGIYFLQANYLPALKNYQHALKIMEKQKNYEGISTALNNIGNIHMDLKEPSTAIVYFKKNLEIKRKLKSANELARAYNNIAFAFRNMNILDSAEYFYKEGLKAFKPPVDLGIEGSIYSGLGEIYSAKHDFESALKYYRLAMDRKKKTGLPTQICYANYHLGNLYLRWHKADSSIYYLEKAYHIAKDINFTQVVSLTSGNLAEIYSKNKKFDKAYSYLLEHKRLSEKLADSDTKKAAIRQNMRYEFEKKEALAKLEQDKKDAITREKSQKQQYIIIFISLLLLCVVGLVVFVYRSFLEKRKANVEISKQKELVDEKQKEILDSIHYAKRIQSTLLANDHFLNEHLPGNFVLFKPKDIVSGDFYWACSVNSKQNSDGGSLLPTADCQLFYLAVCDSTGHGVPGAFMSLLNIGFLSEAINEKNIFSPNEVFDYVRTRLVNSISKEDQKDGFDGVLLCIEKGENHKKITYAAANNAPLLISGNNQIVLPKDKMPVGKGERISSFELFEIPCQPGDMLYLYTDGYADQFGGIKGKKFRYKQLEEMLMEVSQLPVSEQKNIINNRFEEWKGSLEQVDDVCVVGIKI
ncbi:MAG: tetratricopeptide repeat protein, partial [Bacteroidia bacterium]